MNKVYALVQTGGYSLSIAGIFSTEDAAHLFYSKNKKDIVDNDDYHTYSIVEVELDPKNIIVDGNPWDTLGYGLDLGEINGTNHVYHLKIGDHGCYPV